MRTGLLLGKFMPLHLGHRALIRFAAERCDRLCVWLCVSPSEPISGAWRCMWLEAELEAFPHAELRYVEYSEQEYPNTSVSDQAVSAKWAEMIRRLWPDFSGPEHVVFSSEPYGAYLAENLDAACETFDIERRQIPISASMIRSAPYKYWELLPEPVRLFWVDSVCLVGTESTGKTTLTKHLAEQFDSPWISEAGRDIVGHTEECRWEDLLHIAEAHARSILDALKNPCRRLFVDTDVTITQSYARYLFDRPLEVSAWIRAANRFKLYLFCDRDAPYVQDGTRLPPVERDHLHESHLQSFGKAHIPLQFITGDSWEERRNSAIRQVVQAYPSW